MVFSAATTHIYDFKYYYFHLPFYENSIPILKEDIQRLIPRRMTTTTGLFLCDIQYTYELLCRERIYYYDPFYETLRLYKAKEN